MWLDLHNMSLVAQELKSDYTLQNLKYDIHTKIGMKLWPLESYQKLDNSYVTTL